MVISMNVIDYSRINQFDLAFVTPLNSFNPEFWLDVLVSRAIEIVSPNFIHVGIIINCPKDDGFITIYSAERTGIHPRNIKRYEKVVILRPTNLDLLAMQIALNKSYKEDYGTAYGVDTAIRAGILALMGLKSKHNIPMAKICSSLVDKVFLDANYDLSINTHSQDVVPDQLYFDGLKTGMLEEIKIYGSV